MIENNKILLGKAEGNPVYLLPSMLNRHGLIAGATGTGKTTTLKVIAEGLSDLGVPVFLADVKGDLSGMAKVGSMNDNLEKRLTSLGISNFSFKDYPTRFYDVFQKEGHPVRTTISEMGPLLLSRLLGLTDVQEGVLSLVFRIADDQNLLLVDTKDLRSMLQYCGEHSKDFTTEYGKMSSASLGSIQRSLLALEDEGADLFFGEPQLDIWDWLKTNSQGQGYINILECEQLFQNPKLYSTVLLWMLSDLYSTLPEVGDLDKPKAAFFFDEAHLLFEDAPKVLLEKIEQMVKLIRSKGVCVFFITQAPTDIPGDVLAQLSNRIQHALRAYTPAEQKTIKAVSESFRENPTFKTEDVLTQLGVGEALVSALDDQGVPGVVQRTMILCPQSFMGKLEEAERTKVIQSSEIYGKYEKAVDNVSAYEILSQKQQEEQAQKQAEEEAKAKAKTDAELAKMNAQAAKAKEKEEREAEKEKAKQYKYVNKVANSALSSVGREIGRKITRGIFGAFKL